MPRPFSPESERNLFELPQSTRLQIHALMLDLDLTATDVVVRAIAELWQREIGEPERDLAAEIDEISQEIQKIKQRLGMA